MEKEIWKDIDGFTGYQVSSHGNVRSFKKGVGLGRARGMRYEIGDIPKLLKPFPTSESSGRHLLVGLWRKDDSGKSRGNYKLVHKLVLEAFVGPCPRGLETRHVDGNPNNNHVDNLIYGTHTENMQDMLRHGTARVGELARDAKLKSHQVLEIRERYARGGITQQQLADEYDVGHTIIGSIIHRKKWKHI